VRTGLEERHGFSRAVIAGNMSGLCSGRTNFSKKNGI